MPTRWIVLSGLVVARLAFAFQLQSVAVVAPGLMQDLTLDPVAIGTLAGLFMLPGLILAIPGGMLSQKIGERRFLISCLLAMTLGGAICGLAESYWVLWFGRLISGFGAIGMNVAMSKIVIDWFAGKEIATAMALFLTGFPGGIALALVSLGYFATVNSWPLAFFATAAFSFLALIVFVLTYRQAPQSDVTGASTSKLSTAELGMVSLSGLIWALYNAAYMIVVSFVPLYLISQGLSAGTAASLVGIGLWIAIVAGPLGGYLVDRLGRPNMIISAGVLFWGFGLLLVIPWSTSIPLLVALFAVTYLIGNIPPGPIVALASEVLRPDARGAGMGVFYTWLYLGLAVGPMMAGYVLDVSGEPASSLYLVAFLSLLTIVALAIFRAFQARWYSAPARNAKR